MIKIRFFGQVAELCNTQERDWSMEKGMTVQSLTDGLEQTYPGLEELTYRIARNAELVEEGTELSSGDEVALLPPFAGG